MQTTKLLSRCTLPFPSKVFVVSKLPDKLCIVGQTGVEKIKKYLSSNLRTETAIVLDVNPGTGVLSRSLLDAGLQTIHVLNKTAEEVCCKLNVSTELNVKRQEPAMEFDDRAHVHDVGFTSFDDDNLTEIISDIAPCDSWPEVPPLKAIVTLSPLNEHRIINYLFTHMFAEQSGLFACKRPEIYLCVSYFQASSISADYKVKNYMNYRSRSVLIQSLFDFEILDKIPWTEFDQEVPLKRGSRKSTTNKTNDFFNDQDNSFLIKLTPKANLPSLIPLESLQEYRFFVTQSMVRRTNYVIPYFEKWFPSCGPRLIKAGIPLFSKFGDTSPDTFLDIFNLINQWPEYATSTFKAASISHVLLSLDEPDDILLASSSSLDTSQSPQSQQEL